MHVANHASGSLSRTPPVFISGSLSIRHLPTVVKERLCAIVDQALPVVIGDARGADAAVQRFLADCGVRHVTVFCSDTSPRHNLGHWPVQHVRANAPSGTRAFHNAKDREMSGLAGAGFVIWDGSSQGSRANIRHLCERGRYIVVFLRAENRFAVLSSNAKRMAFLTSGRLD
ncbi:hypothetical protein CA262_05705 [Sphingobium sp. GW456-12-10-14-TSB1]|jgi:hypothetical protein|uniref:Uncharacterized protein n=2 Tax=Sphingomonadaceae TaxID=41297 RepID=A0A1E1EY25_9SPHN|nr:MULTISPECIES: hypothetical protein [Sphingomonadaceae]MYL97792.1 hypothetical protein [Novosphingobium silvae]OUC54416.1 hypothetical protein CA262_05705 [Sphingobium sp. GW456-12-10-14-TSB1]BAV63154.1 hypothetical protein SCLO_1001140 [Sphingobium cloacae]HPB23884.1 hypothetical protein [Novosphingobium sp.]